VTEQLERVASEVLSEAAFFAHETVILHPVISFLAFIIVRE